MNLEGTKRGTRCLATRLALQPKKLKKSKTEGEENPLEY